MKLTEREIKKVKAAIQYKIGIKVGDVILCFNANETATILGYWKNGRGKRVITDKWNDAETIINIIESIKTM